MQISDQAKDLVKSCFEGRPLCVPFTTAHQHPGSWINWLSQESLHVTMWESGSCWQRVIYWYFARIKCGNIVPGWLWIVLSVPGNWLIVWFPEVVGRIQVCRGARVTIKNILHKHKNASWVFSQKWFCLRQPTLGSRKVDSRCVLVGHLATSLVVWETERL